MNWITLFDLFVAYSFTEDDLFSSQKGLLALGFSAFFHRFFLALFGDSAENHVFKAVLCRVLQLGTHTLCLLNQCLTLDDKSFLVGYSRVHISPDEVFSKILKKQSIGQKIMIPHMKAKINFIGKNKLCRSNGNPNVPSFISCSIFST